MDARAASPGPPARRLPVPRWVATGLACVVVAALSLLLSHQTTYDPTAWLIWGREILHNDLSTTSGPSWKPLPMAVTVPAALFGLGTQQAIWVVVARTGALVALCLAYRLAARLAGGAAGVLAVIALLLSTGFASFVWRGNSEGILVALALGLVAAHFAGRRRLAFALVFLASLLRPEMWPVAAGYGLWLVWQAPPGRARRATLAVIVTAGAAILALWLVPEKLGSGSFLRAASRAREPVAGSPATRPFPFGATFTNAAYVLPWPVYAGGLYLVARAWPAARRSRASSLPLALAAFATLEMVLVALMAQGGFTGNSRYLAVPVALTSVLGSAGLVRAAQVLRDRPGHRAGAVVAAAALVAAAFFALDVLRLGRELDKAHAETSAYAALPHAIDAAGGRAGVLRCGHVVTTAFDTQAVARDLGLHEHEVGIAVHGPATIVVRRGAAVRGEGVFGVIARTSRWSIASSCASRGG